MAEENNNRDRTFTFPKEPLRFTVECAVEVTEKITGKRSDGRDNLNVTYRFLILCNNLALADAETIPELSFDMPDGNQIFWYSYLRESFNKLNERLPDNLMVTTLETITEGIHEAMRDDDYVPPRTSSDWTKNKLEQAILKAFSAVPNYRTPTFKSVADVLNKRYKLTRPLTGEALRKQVKRHDVDWKELKNIWSESRKRTLRKRREEQKRIA